MKPVNSTLQFYDAVVALAERFARELFGERVEMPLLTLKRGSQSLAHFSAARWQNDDGHSVGEIALNPALFGQHSWLRLLQCLAQQLCHHWQHQCGNPSRPGYHNREWATKLEQLGLMPSSTGKPGGRQTGQTMDSYPIAGGRFLAICEKLVAGDLRMPVTARWTERPRGVTADIPFSRRASRRLLMPVGSLSDVRDADGAAEARELKRKLKYRCERCGLSVWGRSGLLLDCRACNVRLDEIHSNLKPVAVA